LIEAPVSFRSLQKAVRDLGLDTDTPVLAHVSLSIFGEISGGAKTVVGVLLSQFISVMMPTFTYKTMIVPETGPANNAIEYGKGNDANKMAIPFSYNMPADKLMGVVHETLRTLEGVKRSRHPIMSFSGMHVSKYLKPQSVKAVLAPVAAMADDAGWVLQFGVDHSSNTSIHLGERLAKRKTFTRWAMEHGRITTCPGFPSCSDGFNAITTLIAPFIREVAVGTSYIRAIPMPELIETVRQLILADPLALLCDKPQCERCEAVRKEVKG
jgi:aminoglycoside 3-N-acetyltransferase